VDLSLGVFSSKGFEFPEERPIGFEDLGP